MSGPEALAIIAGGLLALQAVAYGLVTAVWQLGLWKMRRNIARREQREALSER